MSYIRAEVSGGVPVTVNGSDYSIDLFTVFQADPSNPSVWAGLNDDARGVGLGSLQNYGDTMPDAPVGYSYGAPDSTDIKAIICTPG